MTEPILVNYKCSIELPLNEIYPIIELREENGIIRAYDAKGEEVCIPSPPESEADLNKWLHACSPSVLEAARQYYYDKWLWDSGDIRHRDLAGHIEAYRHVAYTPPAVAMHYCPYNPFEDSE